MPSNFARVLDVYYIMVVSPIRAGRIFGKMAAPFRCEDGQLFWGASPFARRMAHRRGMAPQRTSLLPRMPSNERTGRYGLPTIRSRILLLI